MHSLIHYWKFAYLPDPLQLRRNRGGFRDRNILRGRGIKLNNNRFFRINRFSVLFEGSWILRIIFHFGDVSNNKSGGRLHIDVGEQRQLGRADREPDLDRDRDPRPHVPQRAFDRLPVLSEETCGPTNGRAGGLHSVPKKLSVPRLRH